ncbi:glycosyltransferase [Micromonospora sp. MA102]|uniref:glycosyltransferase n=1 Tax=Micromonospora sp. MA102 TaxID=2952755 RepID=UPI0021C8099C|nr:glycosyltransferase [Micromonospora sp. MA102]
MTAFIPRQPGTGPEPDTVLAMVGTDVHRFDRLVGWLERWWTARADGARQVRLVLQYGSSTPPNLPDAVPFLAHEDLQRAIAEASVVVCHGGPATITEARRTGHLPIVVPRDPTRHEHVDNHQQLFARRLGAAGMVRLVETEADLVESLDKALVDPRAFRLVADPDLPDPRAAAAVRVGQIVEDLVRQRASGRRRWRR